MAITWSCLSAISKAKARGDPKKPKLGMAYLLMVPAQAVEEERKFWLVAMWVHPCQTLLSLLEEAAKKLTLLINTGDNWPYTFVQLCEDSQHVSLSNTGHISIMVDGASNRSTCGCLGCLEVCKLLQCSSEVVYPEILNGGFKLIQVPLPKQPVWDAESTNKPAILQVNLPRTTCRDMTTAASQGSLMPISCPHSATECPSDIVTRASMEEEVVRLLSGALCNTPEQSWCKEKATLDLGEIISIYLKQPPPYQQESSQVGVVDITALFTCSPSPTLGTLEGNSTPNPPESQAHSITLPDNVLHLQQEMNNAMFHLLTFRASVDTHQ